MNNAEHTLTQLKLWCIAQSKELMAKEVPVLHYYTMSKAEETEQIAAAIF